MRSSKLAALWVVAGLLALPGPLMALDAAPRPLKKFTAAVPVTAIPVSTAMYSSLPKALGYWKDEGLDVNVIPVSGSSLVMQMTLTGQVDFGSVGLPAYLAARAQSDKVSSYYCIYARNQFLIATLPGSPVRTLKDMAGRRFGVASLASSSVPFTKAALAEAKVDLNSVQFLPLSGSPAANANALSNGTVDGLAVYDSIVGGVSAILNKDLHLVETPYDDLLKCGLAVAVRSATLKDDPAAAAGFARGIAKATAFAMANPEAAVRIHWKTYPETRPRGDEAAAMKAALAELNARLKTMAVHADKGGVWGDISPASLEAYEKFLFESGEIKSIIPTQDAFNWSLIKDINNWDQAKLMDQARKTSGQ